jgi:hypothetical protein
MPENSILTSPATVQKPLGSLIINGLRQLGGFLKAKPHFDAKILSFNPVLVLSRRAARA